jgi:hypothetical protein
MLSQQQESLEVKCIFMFRMARVDNNIIVLEKVFSEMLSFVGTWEL